MDTDSLDQLRKTYAEMSEDELDAIAADAYDLTDAAKGALRKEISRRGLNIELRTVAIVQDDSAAENGPEEPQEEAAEDEGQVSVVCCPKCHSDKAVPVWRCGDCGHEWEDDDDEADQTV